jgi:hypothetical protein
MVLLLTFSVLTGLGLATFVIGWILDLPAIAMIGAVLILASGALALDGPVEVKVGEDQINGSSSTDESFRNVYDPISEPDQFSLGFVTMLLGALGTLHSLNKFSEGG